MIRELILLLKRGYLEPREFQDKFGVDIWEHFHEVWQNYADEGWVVRRGDRIELTMQGLLRADGLLPAFFEPEHQGVRYT
jgi:oxygen-independent coproporphyrinogen-3 oxidase